MQNLHFLCQTLILFAKAVQFCCISFLTPLRFSRAKRLNLKTPRLQLCACYSKLFGYTALRCARLIKPINSACLKLVGICSSMLSQVVSGKWWKLFNGVSGRFDVCRGYAARSRISSSG